MATVTYDKASRIYPGTERPAVNELNLEIGDGEFLVLVGPSGCGKSTSLRMLAGLEDVDRGRILIQGKDVTNLPPKSRDIAMVFQNYALYPHMSVYENMAFALKLRKTSKAEIDLMDEPLSNLDAKLRVQTRSQIATLQAKLGVTTVYVTHDQVEAMTMGHRVAVMLDGVLQQVDTPRALYDTPGNVFVAGFMGSPAMNIKTVSLTESGGSFGSMTIPLSREQLSAARSGGGKVTIGFRPEAADLVSETQGGMPIVVDLVEDLGSDANVYGHAELDSGAERFVVRTDRRHMPTMGETVYVKPQTAGIHVFNATSGERI